MDHMALLKKFIRDKEDSDIVGHGFPFVTITRQAGAGGHILARTILEELDKRSKTDELFEGWDLFDQTVCALVMQDPDISASFDSLVSEEYRSETQQMVADIFTGRSEQYATYKRIFEIVRILGTLGKAVIIGRAGVCVTRNLPHGIHIRLIASEETRIKNVMLEQNTAREAAIKSMKKQDSERERLIRDFFDADLDNFLLYDAVFNVDKQNSVELAKLIVQMIRSKAKKN